MATIEMVPAGTDIFPTAGTPVCPIQDALAAIRQHLGMEVAYFSEFVDGRSVFRRVDAPGLEHLIKAGDSQSLDDVYCNHILEGRLPELIPDTSRFPLAVSMPITAAVPIGSHASIPVRLRDGRPYGMFCCLSPRPNPTLNDRDLAMLRTFAEIAARQVNSELEQTLAARAARTRIEQVLATRAFRMVYQPIHDVRTRALVAYEALCRVQSDPVRTPDLWFAEAASVGLGLPFELAAIAAAVEAFPALPSDVALSVNASPEVVLSGRLIEALDARYLERTVVEVTEHAAVGDYAALRSELASLSARGVRIAVDDAGAGYAGLQQLLQLAPDVIKLDMSLVRGIDTDAARRALASAMTYFARETGALVVAEGVETEGEFAALAALGVERVQGWLLGKPRELPIVVPVHVAS